MQTRWGVRQRLSRVAVAAVLAIVVLAPAVPSAAAPPHWNIVRLRPVTSGNATYVTDVNNANVAVGHEYTANGLEIPTVWDAAGNPTALPLGLGANQGLAWALNDAGTIVGTVGTKTGGNVTSGHGVAWVKTSSGYELVDLGAEVGPSDINASGLIAGHVRDAELVPQPRLLRIGQAPTPLPVEQGSGLARRVNSAGVAIGQDGVTVGAHIARPVAWYQDARYDLLPGMKLDTVMVDVTDSFFAVGNLSASGRILAFAIAPGGHVYPLAPDQDISRATDMNESGVAVGAARTGTTGDPRAALFVYGTTVMIDTLVTASDLAAVGPFYEAVAINDHHAIVGHGLASDGPTTGWLLTPPR